MLLYGFSDFYGFAIIPISFIKKSCPIFIGQPPNKLLSFRALKWSYLSSETAYLVLNNQLLSDGCLIS